MSDFKTTTDTQAKSMWASRAMQLLNGVHDGIFIFDPESLRFSYVNQGAAEQVGYSRDELRNMTPLDIKPEFDEPRFRKILEPLLSGAQSSLTFNTVHRHKQGECIPVEVSLQCLVDTAESRSLVAVVRDVTKRVEAERERDRFFSLSLDILCIANKDGYFKRVNPAFGRILGWSEVEILSRPFMDFVHPDDREATAREVERQTVAGETVFNFENRYRHKDGSWRVLSWRSVPQPGGLMYATARDVTEAKQAEDILRRSEQKLAITLDSISDAVISMDADRHITRMNPIAERLTGWTQSEAMGRPIDEVFRIIDDETRKLGSVPNDDQLTSGIIHGPSMQTVLISRDGTECPIDESSAPILGQAEQITGVVLAFRDVSKERQHKRELQRLNIDLEYRVRQRTLELTESERFSRATLDSLSAHVAVLDASGKIVATNHSWREFADANDSTWQAVSEGTNYLAICDRAEGNADAIATAHAIRQVLDGEKESWTREYPCHSADQQRWFYCRVTRFPGEGDVYVVVTHENITSMKQAQEQLAADRARFETLDRVSPVAIMFFDSIGKCSDVNDRWCEMSGINREEASGDHWSSTVHAEDRTRVVGEWSIAVRDGTPSHSEHRLQRANGEILWVDCQGVPTQNANGIVDGFVQAYSDVTERRKILRDLQLVAKELQEAEAFAATIIENVSGLFYVLDQDGIYVRWNQSLQDQLGYSSEQMRRTNGISTIHEEDRARIAQKMSSIYTYGHAETSEARLILKGGYRHFLLNGRRLEIHGKVFLIGSGADITDRKQSETEILLLNQTLEQRVSDRTFELTFANEQLTQASQFKSDFLASMSHELRTPLNGVLGMNELLLKTPLTDEQRQFVDASITSGTSLLSLINNVLDISKIEAGMLELDIGVCDLEALADDIITMFRHRAEKKGISLSCRMDPDACVAALCDNNRLRQVLVNLIENALKFTTTGGVLLEFKCLQRQERQMVIQVAVTDTGLGIPDDKLSRLFSPFSQVDRSTSRHYGGTGLGLSITKQLVELMGGTIGVTSQAGAGSTFWAKIPLELVKNEESVIKRRHLLEGSPSPDAVADKPPRRFSGHILVAEDNKINQMFVRELLKHSGCTCDIANNGDEALIALQSNIYDLVMMDCQMPEMDGFAATREIRRLEAAGELPGRLSIIALTANALKGDREKCLCAGMDDHLSKPLQTSHLHSMLARFLASAPTPQQPE